MTDPDLRDDARRSFDAWWPTLDVKPSNMDLAGAAWAAFGAAWITREHEIGRLRSERDGHLIVCHRLRSENNNLRAGIKRIAGGIGDSMSFAQNLLDGKV